MLTTSNHFAQQLCRLQLLSNCPHSCLSLATRDLPTRKTNTLGYNSRGPECYPPGAETLAKSPGKVRNARGDYFLNFSSLTGIPKGPRPFFTRHRADFFRGLVSTLHSSAARWAVALNARPRNNLYSNVYVCVLVCVRETER